MEAATFRFVSLLALGLFGLLGLSHYLSMALMLWHYGPVELAVGPGCSRLVQRSSIPVHGIKYTEFLALTSSTGLVLYGLAGAPPLDVPAEWSEARRVVVPAKSHREWPYFLNKGAQIEAAFSIMSETDVPYPLCTIIAQGKAASGKERFMQRTEKPSAQNSALSWHSVQAIFAVVLLLLFVILNMLFGPCTVGGALRGVADRRTALLTSNDDDGGANLGSSYDSVSHDGSDGAEAEERGEGGCVVCCDAPKDCFHPCGHSASCYAYGARIIEENGGCPFCRRKLKCSKKKRMKLKKARRIFAV
ncbi:hypothetical protein BAE44_0014597 [Dichanthelium oligosanthes]|uniref:E3 ubiquitin-protein ligase APD1-4 N-terminal domain-containing protein n=1 Tax=Dichanthelium oligosanthes TaxID=888268 RepID=A0A1E5VGY7_9POAL|nr:hypothetical protein BAE44_0014597 [Dichanthelium oligosanthes]